MQKLAAIITAALVVGCSTKPTDGQILELPVKSKLILPAGVDTIPYRRLAGDTTNATGRVVELKRTLYLVDVYE